MDIVLNIEKSRFELEMDGLIAVADFILKPGVMAITHVIVPPRLRGDGVATGLAHHIVAYAREEGLKIEPRCPFMAVYFQRHPEIRDLLA